MSEQWEGSTCGDCGMRLLSRHEFHPHGAACLLYRGTADIEGRKPGDAENVRAELVRLNLGYLLAFGQLSQIRGVRECDVVEDCRLLREAVE